MLSTAGARVVGISDYGVYLGFLFGFSVGQAGQRCKHVVVIIVPSPYLFPPSHGLLEVQCFPLFALTAIHQAFTLAAVVFIILVVLFISHSTHIIPKIEFLVH